MLDVKQNEKTFMREYLSVQRKLKRLKVVFAIFLVLVVLAAAIVTSKIILYRTQPDLVQGEAVILDQPDEVIETDEHRVTVQSLAQIITPASDLISTKYYYTNANSYEDYKNVKGFKIPLTTTKIVFTYDGVIGLGFDISLIQFEIDDNNKVITVKLPEIEVVTNEVDDTSFKYYDVAKSMFNEIEMQKVTDLIAELKESEAQKVLQNEKLLAQTQQNAQTIITGLLQAADVTKEYSIVYK